MPTLGAYVNNTTYEKYKNIAIEKNLSISKVVKQSLESSKIVDTSESEKLEREKLNELKRIGTNMNQIAKHCNIHKSVDISVLKRLHEIKRIMDDG